MSAPSQETPRARGPFLAQLGTALDKHGQLAHVKRRLSRAAAGALASPDPDAWVDESVVVEILETAHAVVGDDERWHAMLREESAGAIQRFYRLFLRHATPNMLFLALPRMWTMTHSTGSIAVRWHAGHSGLVVEYKDHPPMASPVYRDLTVAVLEALLALNRTRASVSPRDAARGDSSFEVEVRLL